jgi:uncharacterized protein (DUF362 family)
MGNMFTESGRSLVSKIVHSGSLEQDIQQAVDAIGGFQRLIAPGETILVKPNFNTSDPPPGSSDPEFVREVIRLLYRHGAEKVVLGESSMIRLPTSRALKEVGMLRMAEEAGAEVVLFDEQNDWVTVETGGRYLRKVALARAALEADKIVYVCCLKTHFLADFTMSLKLAMGFVRPRDRLWMHARHLREKLAELNLAIAPDLSIIDGRRCFISGGPSTGELREPNLILASGDQIAVDVEGLKVIMGYEGHDLEADPWSLTMVRRAVELELGARTEAEYRLVVAAAGSAV